MERVNTRIGTAYRPKTVRAHNSHFKLFPQFLQFIGIDIKELSHVSVLAFLEFLQVNGLSHASIEAYMSSLRSQFRVLYLSIAPFSHHTVTLTLRSLALNVPMARKAKDIFDLPTLHAIIDICDRLPLGYIYKPLFLLSFFAFLRLSNLVPPSINEFSPIIHLCRADVIPQLGFATVILKWSKSL